MRSHAILFLLYCVPAFGQTGSEIFLFDMKERKGKIVLSNPKNITRHKGYDNQPFFHTDLPVIYYASFNDEGRSDIKRYNYKKGNTDNVTTTPEREYSPTLTPDKQYLSCIIQRDNNAQDLGKYPLDGGEPLVIINDLVVGYHVWADNSHLAMFVLGTETTPNTLHYVRLPTKEDKIVTENIGRSLHKIPGERAISFIQKLEGSSNIMKLDTESMKVSLLTATISNGDHIAWTPKGKILTTDGAKLFFLDQSDPGSGWQPVIINEGLENLKSVTRLAVNAKGDKLAVVVGEE